MTVRKRFLLGVTIGVLLLAASAVAAQDDPAPTPEPTPIPSSPITKIERETAAGYVAWGDLFRGLDLPEPAISAYTAALALDPDNGSAYTGLGRSHADLEDYIQALSRFPPRA